MMPPAPAISVAIVGAGFGGLSLAIALKNAGLTPTIFEAQFSRQGDCGTSIVGDLHLPSGKESLHFLQLSDTWDDLTKQTQRLNYVPQEALQRKMQQSVSDFILCNTKVLGVEEDKSSGRLYCIIDNDRRSAGNNSRCTGSGKKTLFGPFEVVVGADGVLSSFRNARGAGQRSGRVAILGDARWVQDRFDLGTRRIRCGADIAIRDGVELAQILSESTPSGNVSLGKFCAIKKRREIFFRRGNIAVITMAAMLGRSFPFKDHKTNLVPVIFLSALMHISGKVRIRLPISPIPVTMHTLVASWLGMALGSTVTAQGAGLYSLLWTVFHLYTRQDMNSWGYVVGLMSCAILSGGLYSEGVHPMLAASFGQCCTLLLGSLWLVVNTDDSNSTKPLAIFRGGILPFIPGLVLKSFAAWKLLLMDSETGGGGGLSR